MAHGSRLPGVERADGADRIVCHVDADCFYASCERLREPKLRGEPVVVGMGYEPGDTVGAVATASYEARAVGVESAQAISTALERLPRRASVDLDSDADSSSDLELEETGYYRPVDMDYYESVAADVREILHECADVVREVSIDEAYLDVTSRTAWEVADGFARHVKDRVRREVGLTVSVGVAPSMSAAKIASDFDKPDGLTVVQPDEVREFLTSLPVELLHGVGPVTARELREMGLETAGDVAAADPEPLVERFGERGRELFDRARGEDDRRVEPKGKPKSFSREAAFPEPVEEPKPKYDQIETLAAAVADRARREGALYRTVGVKAVTPPYDVNTRERSVPGPIDDPDLVGRLARDLFTEFDDSPVRKLGVRVANLEFASVDQASLDSWETDRDERTALGRTEGESSASGNERTDIEGGDERTEADDETTAGVFLTDLPDDQTSLSDFC
ncbi:DNA polymerase IV [Natrarchaeobius halalkaliphilus]|uniref:DNA polymerase IV n=1 Tax=Natrarchaeobius halalkaliphilus TaxID=1679091 RepID=A0A3N6M912_9EURY|nr:DNA polymerase IV [Natrarchaeobius halalkaliphilus]RQG89976.1 DNA polymerase IV [Natrarchaeobius halalkaliphilus]